MKKIALSSAVRNKPRFIQLLNTRWSHFIQEMGYLPIPIPNGSCINSFFDAVKPNAVILTGGNAVNVTNWINNWNHEPGTGVTIRWNLEMNLIQYCIENNVPLFGGCRGALLIGLYFNSKTVLVPPYQSNTHRSKFIQRDNLPNFNKLERTLTHSSAPKIWGFSANTLSSDLKSFAQNEEGIIDGFVHKKFKIAAMTGMPERSLIEHKFDIELVKNIFDYFWST